MKEVKHTADPQAGLRQVAAGAAPELSSPAWQAQQLQLWLVASLSGLPETALAGLGLDAAALTRLKAEHAADLAALQGLQRAGRLMTRGRMAELLRARVSGMALAARTSSEMAAVARSVRSLPEWVWDDATVAGDSAANSAAQQPRGGAPASEPQSGLAGWQPVMPGAGLMGGSMVGLNRQQRRALEAEQRKGR